MGAAPVGVDGVAEAEGSALDLVDHPVGTQELDAPELAPAGMACSNTGSSNRVCCGRGSSA